MAESSRCFENFFLKAILWFITILGCLCIGCGGSNSSSSVPSSTVSAMNGNYSISTTSAGTSGLNSFPSAIQTDSAGHAGTMQVRGPLLLCFGVNFALPLTGTIDSLGHLNATIAGSNNQTITLNATLSQDGALLSNGTYSGSGTGCVAGDHGPVTGFQVQAFTGAYSGNFSLSASPNMTLALSLAQSATPGIDGMFPVTASAITVTGGAACGFSSATLSAGSASGNDLQLVFLGSDNVSTMTFIGVVTDGSTSLVRGLALLINGPCNMESAVLNLNRP
jgi:hypothetical protein